MDSLVHDHFKRPYVSGGSRDHKVHVSGVLLGRKFEAAMLLDDGVRFLTKCLDVGMDRNFIADTAKLLHDQFGDVVGRMQKDLAAERLTPEDADIDMSELDALLAKMEGR